MIRRWILATSVLMLITFGIAAVGQRSPKGKGPKKCKPNKNRVCLVTPDRLPTGFVGVPYSVEIRVEGGTAPYTWKIGSGLPPGLTFTPNGEGDTLVVTGEYLDVVRFIEGLKDPQE